jgi:hypothetical protein
MPTKPLSAQEAALLIISAIADYLFGEQSNPGQQRLS